MKSIVFFVILLVQSGYAANYTLKEIGLATVETSLAEQVNTDSHKLYWRGEFPTKIKSTLVPALVGVGKLFGKDDEASGFTTASVLNVLGEIYLHHPELSSEFTLSKIPLAFAAAMPTFSRYEDKGSFNFYPPLILKNGQMVHRPIDMTLFPIWHGFTNVPNDSDTTAVILATKAIYMQILGENPSANQEALQQIEKYRDLDRNPMLYNRKEKRKNTGAFMTWIFDEHDPQRPGFFMARSKQGPRIPFSKNDVDCVVNANVLKLLAIIKTDISGKKEACEMLNSMIEKDESSSCGVYYPNTYNLPFSLGAAKSFGDQCLSESNESLLIARIIKQQRMDGSWTNIGNIWQDETLSTAFALYGLLTMQVSPSPAVKNSVLNGIRYLLEAGQRKDGRYVWKEDNFFTATAIARSLIMWRSKAYTHAIIAAVFLKASQIFPELTEKEILNNAP